MKLHIPGGGENKWGQVEGRVGTRRDKSREVSETQVRCVCVVASLEAPSTAPPCHLCQTHLLQRGLHRARYRSLLEMRERNYIASSRDLYTCLGDGGKIIYWRCFYSQINLGLKLWHEHHASKNTLLKSLKVQKKQSILKVEEVKIKIYRFFLRKQIL
jgi:hypothetical protein